MKKITLLFLVFSLSILSYNVFATDLESSKEFDIKGKVIDTETGGPLEYATVSLFYSQDSTFVNGVITDMKGAFSLKAKAGKYYIVVQFIGYETKTVNINLKDDITLGNIMMRPDSAMLDEVEVVAEKSTMSMTLDKRVFNVGKDVSSTAGNAIEVLDNIPSVNVDVDGNVSLRGDSGVQILVDGKVSGLAGMSTQDALRSLQADMIEKIEVVTNPSVRYDAEGTAGIINIVLKKDKRKGFNASVDLRGGFPVQWGEKFFKEDFPFQTGVGASLNYRFKRVNVFANYNFNYRDDISDGYTMTEYFNGDYGYDPMIENHDDATQITEQYTYRNRNRKGHNVRAGFDYYFTDNDILTFSTMFRQSRGYNTPSVTYIDNFPFEGLKNFSRRTEDWFNDRPMMEYTLSYDKYFGTKDNSLKASVRYFNNTDREWSDIVDAEFWNEDSLNNNIPYFSVNQYTDAKEYQQNLQATVDFVNHYGLSTVELGGKYTGRFINNNMMVKEDDVILEDYTHDFNYNQQVAALYGSYGREFGRFSGQLGLRTEFTYIDAYMKDDADKNKPQQYLDFFPTGHLNFKLTEIDQLQASYARRIRRPWYGQMAPFHSFNDDRNIRTGNPDLKPVYTDSYEMSYLRFWEKGNINFTAYYRHSTDVIRNFTTVIDDISYSRPENFGISDDYGLELVGSLDVFKWWNLNGSINFFRSNTVGDWNDRHYTTESYNTFARLVTKFRVKNVCDFQITGRYMGPHEEPLGYRDANYWCDFAASRDVFNKNATISLNIRDVFGSRQHGGESWGDNFWQYSESTWSTTTVTINFNYRINQQQNKRRMPSSPSGDGDSYEGEMEY
ncbi:MAG: TonB-dependent receptor [Bacteroidales bacterium]|nr:TonB-dependent receptor [Bacteroidales bacterium]